MKKESSMDTVAKNIVNKSLEEITNSIERKKKIQKNQGATVLFATIATIGTYIALDLDVQPLVTEILGYIGVSMIGVLGAKNIAKSNEMNSIQYEKDVETILNAYENLDNEKAFLYERSIKHLQNLGFDEYDLICSAKQMVFNPDYLNENIVSAKTKEDANKALEQYKLVA